MVILAVKDPTRTPVGAGSACFSSRPRHRLRARPQPGEKLGLKAQDLAEISSPTWRCGRLPPRYGERGLRLPDGQPGPGAAVDRDQLEAAATAALGGPSTSFAAPVRARRQVHPRRRCPPSGGRPGPHRSGAGPPCRRALSGSDAAVAKLYCTELQSRVSDRCLARPSPSNALRAESRLGNAYLDGRGEPDLRRIERDHEGDHRRKPGPVTGHP